MLDVISMFGVKIHLHRSLLILGVIICFVFIYILLPDKKDSPLLESISFDNDEDINLIDLFNNAFKLTYQAGQAIKIIKNTKKNFGKILKKKSFQNLESEPITVADLISHSIITNGLKSKFTNLQVLYRTIHLSNLLLFFVDCIRRKRFI